MGLETQNPVGLPDLAGGGSHLHSKYIVGIKGLHWLDFVDVGGCQVPQVPEECHCEHLFKLKPEIVTLKKNPNRIHVFL